MLTRDLRTICQLLRRPKGDSLGERLEDFYKGQARSYDDFRQRLLPGREELILRLPEKAQGTWADLGCGTGNNLRLMNQEEGKAFEKIYLVDLSPSLLQEAAHKIKEGRFSNVNLVEEDICLFQPQEKLDLVTFSFSLTMIPDWKRALDHAYDLLKPGGHIGIVDFYVSEKFPLGGLVPHGLWTRKFWPLWFSWDKVYLQKDHLPLLLNRFSRVELFEGRHRLPYLPAGGVPYYLFVGRKD